MNILGISEVRWKGAGDLESDGYKVIYAGGRASMKEGTMFQKVAAGERSTEDDIL